jgi:hypothetical protein
MPIVAEEAGMFSGAANRPRKEVFRHAAQHIVFFEYPFHGNTTDITL